MKRRARSKLGGWLQAYLDQGIGGDLPNVLRKRVRLTNVASLFGALVELATLPFDLLEAPRWMVIDDLVAAGVFLSLALLNRRGWFTASRLGFIVVANLLVFSQAAALGHNSGADLLFIALLLVPFALFDFGEWGPIGLGVLLPVVGLVTAKAGWLAPFEKLPSGYVPRDYELYSLAISVAITLTTLYLMSRANAAAERTLRLDIARRQRAEAALAESREVSITSAKMAALGEMSANIAHEVNNPLAAILLRSQRLSLLASRDRLDQAAVLKTAEEIDATVDRIRRIVDALLFFARQADEDPLRPESIATIVQQTVELCAQRFSHQGIQLSVDRIPEDLLVDCRGAQISQVLLNLLSNAYDAVENEPVRRVRIGATVEDGAVRIAVSDSGQGIPEDIAHRIMEPFFTTKDIGKGTGLGLAVSKGIAETHGGYLTHERSGGETHFVLTLRRGAPPEPDPRWPDTNRGTHA
jgi:signal transduction histidine kinase